MLKHNIQPGTVYGSLTILNDDVGRTNNRKRICLCQCSCGSLPLKIVLQDVMNGHTTSCGCVQKEQSRIRAKNSKLGTRSRGISARLASARVVWHGHYDDGCPFETFLEMSQKNCFYCNAPPGNQGRAYTHTAPKAKYSKEWIDSCLFVYNGLDRIDSTKDHSPDNIVPCCKYCNRCKLSMPRSEFYSWISRVHSYLVSQGRIDDPNIPGRGNNL